MEKDAAVVARVLTMYMLVGVLSHLVPVFRVTPNLVS